jgi:hypothetical protein
MLINQETARTLKAYNSFLLFGLKIEKPSTTFKFLVLSQQILQSVCPVNYFVTTVIMKIFQMSFLYSLKTNPASLRFKSLIQEERIVSTLRICRKSLPKLQLFGFESRLYCHSVVSFKKLFCRS